MTISNSGRRASVLALAAALIVTVPALAQTAAPATTQDTTQGASSSSASSAASAQNTTTAPDATTVTIFGKKRQAGDPSQVQIDTHTADSCGFMNGYSPGNEDIVQDYLRDFGMDQNGSNQGPSTDANGNLTDTDQSDPNVAGNQFKDNAPGGDASQDNAANSNTLPTMQVGPGGAPRAATGACGPGDKAFAAGRNYIQRTDTSLKDAFAAFDANDYPKALDLFKKSYNKIGYDQAALMEGKMLVGGMGTARNTPEAIVWLKKVVEAKYDPKDEQTFNPDDPNYMNTRSDAAMLLGKIYLIGWGIKRDPKEALKYYLKAAEFGFIPANYLIGEFYEFGSAGDKDPGKAVTYFTKAAHVGYAPAQYELGTLYYSGEGVAQDKQTAVAWLIEAAKHGNTEALFAVGNMYDQGDTLPQDPSKAAVYYKEAALQGDPESEDALGLYFYTGTGVPKDPETARKLFVEAVHGHNVDAMFNLAVMMANGEGGAKDMAAAYAYMTLAAEAGLDKAAPAAKELATKLTPEEKARADSALNPKPAGK